jgi:hypothetical protein
MRPLTRSILYIGLAIIIIGVLVGVYFYTLGQKDLTNSKADFTLTTQELLSEVAANADNVAVKYQNKVLQVSGTVKQADLSLDSTMIVTLMAPDEDGTVSCSFNTIKDPSSIDLEKGDNVVIRGIFTGITTLFSDVQMTNCVLVEE